MLSKLNYDLTIYERLTQRTPTYTQTVAYIAYVATVVICNILVKPDKA